jgi:DNA-binding transcriptional regulator YbjK
VATRQYDQRVEPAPSRANRYGEGRDALMQATVEVVARDGLRGFSQRAVARRAGVASSLIAHHFGSSDGLLRATLEMAAEVSIARELEDVTGDVGTLGRDLARDVAEDPDLQTFQYEMLLEARRRPELRPLLQRVYDAYRDGLRRELERMGHDEPGDDLARVVFALMDGLVLQQVVFGQPADTERTLARMRELLRDARTDAR